jgi:hypothetical protein
MIYEARPRAGLVRMATRQSAPEDKTVIETQLNPY